MNKQQKQNDDLNEYRLGKFTVLQWMGLLAVLGLAAAYALRYWFGP